MDSVDLVEAGDNYSVPGGAVCVVAAAGRAKAQARSQE